MPLYDYYCESCDGKFEVVRPMVDASRVDCDICGEEAVRCFTPTRNFLIPERFRRDRNWHQPNGPSADSSPASANNQVHKPKRASFKEKFEEAWRG